MSEEIVIVEEGADAEDTAVSPTETTRRVVLAGIGMVVVAGGEIKSLVGKWAESRQATEGNTVQRQPAVNVRRQIKTPVKSLLTRLNIPTKTDIDALNNQVTTLLNKVEKLQQLEQQAPEADSSLPLPANTDTNQTSD
jgi:hypothetical protein